MNIRTFSLRRMPVVVLAFALLLLGAPSLFAPTAVERGTARYWFGMVGLSPLQAARLNVTLIDDPELASSNLTVEMFFFDDQGSVIARSGSHALAAGKSVSFDPASSLCPSDPSIAGQSCRSRAGVLVTGEWDKKGLAPFQFVAATLELLDTETRTTHVVMLPAVQHVAGQQNNK